MKLKPRDRISGFHLETLPSDEFDVTAEKVFEQEIQFHETIEGLGLQPEFDDETDVARRRRRIASERSEERQGFDAQIT